MLNTSETNPAKAPDDKNEKASSPLRELLSWIEVIAIAVILALQLNNFVIVNATVPTGSMENTIMPGDRLLGCGLPTSFPIPSGGHRGIQISGG